MVNLIQLLRSNLEFNLFACVQGKRVFWFRFKVHSSHSSNNKFHFQWWWLRLGTLESEFESCFHFVFIFPDSVMTWFMCQMSVGYWCFSLAENWIPESTVFLEKICPIYLRLEHVFLCLLLIQISLNDKALFVRS